MLKLGVLMLSAFVANAPARAADVFLHGDLAAGIYNYSGVNVIVDGPLTLHGGTTIRVYGGSIFVSAPIDGTGKDHSGDLPRNGEVCDGFAVPQPGEPGSPGSNLTLET